MDLLAFFKTSHSFLLYQFQRLIGCMNLSFFSANQMIHTSNHSTPLFPYIWEIYFISIVRFTFTLAIGFFISLGIGHLFFKVPNSFKKFTTVLNWIPYSFLHCNITMFSLITTSIRRTIYKPSLLLIFYHRM